MGAKEAIEAGFKNLVLREPYAKVTVTGICREAHVSRKTFYANFQDKEDVLASMFEREAVEPMRALNRALSIEQAKSISSMYTENLYAYFESEREFYQKLVGPLFGNDDTFIRVVTRALFAFNMELLSGSAKAAGLEAEYKAYFFGSSQAMFVQKWIADGMPIPPKQLAKFYHDIASGGLYDLYAD